MQITQTFLWSKYFCISVFYNLDMFILDFDAFSIYLYSLNA